MTAAAPPAFRLTRTSLVAGVWEGLLAAADPEGSPPRLSVTHEAQPLDGVELAAEGEGRWRLRVPVPPALLSDGLQSFIVADAESGAVLGSFAILAGAPLAEDIRAELDLLRAEMDLLKRAFRRHCLETAWTGSEG